MSYDLSLIDPVTKEVLHSESPHQIRGGAYAINNDRLHLNITYNYAPFFYKIFGEKGIRAIYGMTGAESLPVIKKAIAQLKDDTDVDYWKPTEGNAKQSLYGLLALAQIRPDGVWDGD